ncbi:hypothetical protein [Alkaliphilus transvaalensis]|uniref:hypothetical protein n=1 Tax=Alkaliphilus transvaalensis TaxID=114628 RepID=UPI0006853185|nr:hypothetical protein [Alkaliphilus transvaalensis]
MKTNRFFGFMLCFLPGAAHMYLGLKKQGLQLMTLFVLPMFLTELVRLSLFMFVLPIIWFYSFFDGLRKINGHEELIDSDVLIFNWLDHNKRWAGDQNKILGYGFIVLGGLLIFDRILMPIVSSNFGWQMRQYIHMGTISVVLILGGVKLLAGTQQGKGKDQ